MQRFPVWAIVCLVGFVSLQRLSAAPAPGARDDNDVDRVLASVPIAELPARAAELVAAAKAHEQEAVALAAVRFAAASRPGSLAPVVGSVSKTLPASASAVAATAAKLAPSESANVGRAALEAAPGQAEQIQRALATGSPAVAAGAPKPLLQRGNRPDVPPGWNVSKPGAIRGNRPDVPPGLVRDPKPGRDPQRRRYGSP